MALRNNNRIKVSLKQALKILFPYITSKIKFQIQAVSFVVIYLILFQIIVLGIAIREAVQIAGGIALVIAGLALFMEGLLIGLMPLGEYCGKQLPRRLHLSMILLFAFVIGVAATLAEPALTVLSTAGTSVKAWRSPLLYALLNIYNFYLILAICIGVGLAVLVGVLRFMYKVSLKPFIMVIIPSLLALSLYMFFNIKLEPITALAWDSGGITTGPVTVPLIIALGIGISSVIADSDEHTSGLGVVTLASAIPIMTVLITGILLSSHVPSPATPDVFYANSTITRPLFSTQEKFTGDILVNCSSEKITELLTLQGTNETEIYNFLVNNPLRIHAYFYGLHDLEVWVRKSAELTARFRTDIFIFQKASENGSLFIKHIRNAVRAIIPLSLILLLLIYILPGDKLPRKDEIFLGIFLSIAGMSVFNAGIDRGLSNLGNQVGTTLPATFTTIEITGQKRLIRNFDESLVYTSTEANGARKEFFYIHDKKGFTVVPYDRKGYNPETGDYVYTPVKGPVAGKQNLSGGYILLILFAFIMGYTVTLAEPALIALGITLEEITVGTFKRGLLLHSVASGVGIGMGFGVLRIIFDIPLIMLLIPPYFILLILTLISEENFVNIAWDSAGVTTGPITVPLLLSMGLGIGQQTGVSHGFGILALASAYPILTVLTIGLFVRYRQSRLLKESYIDTESTVPGEGA